MFREERVMYGEVAALIPDLPAFSDWLVLLDPLGRPAQGGLGKTH